MIFTVDVPGFDIVTVKGGVVNPVVKVPKSSVVGEKVGTREIPSPANATASMALNELLLIVNVAVRTPTTAGVKAT